MREAFKTIGKRAALIAVLALTASAGIALADFVEPTQSPTGGNVAAPINVGTSFQQKTGDFWDKAVMGARTKFQFGTNSAWMNVNSKPAIIAQRFCIGTSLVNPGTTDSCIGSVTQTPSCHLERQMVNLIEITAVNVPETGSNPGKYGESNGGLGYCQKLLSPTALADGWQASGSDICAHMDQTEGKDNCSGSKQKLQCTYVRVVCP